MFFVLGAGIQDRDIWVIYNPVYFAVNCFMQILLNPREGVLAGGKLKELS